MGKCKRKKVSYTNIQTITITLILCLPSRYIQQASSDIHSNRFNKEDLLIHPTKLNIPFFFLTSFIIFFGRLNYSNIVGIPFNLYLMCQTILTIWFKQTSSKKTPCSQILMQAIKRCKEKEVHQTMHMINGHTF
jgi:hypothetical protein